MDRVRPQRVDESDALVRSTAAAAAFDSRSIIPATPWRQSGSVMGASELAHTAALASKAERVGRTISSIRSEIVNLIPGFMLMPQPCAAGLARLAGLTKSPRIT
jgi:hypothetical protein